MQPISDRAEPNSNFETSWEIGDFATPIAGKNNHEDLNKANSAPLIRIFKYYGVLLDERNRACCPFKSHKGGRERTPSFNYYPDTNSYNCFGCDNGGSSSNFVMEMDRCSRAQAIQKIFDLFENDLDDCSAYDGPENSYTERLNIMLSFSEAVRSFYKQNQAEKSHKFVEEACKKYDVMNLKHNLDNKALERLVEQLKDYINLYKE